MKRFFSIILAGLVAGIAVQAGTPLFIDSNFRDFPAGLNVSDASGCTVTIAQGTAPTGNADTESLQLSDTSATAQCGIKPLINGGNTYSGPMIIELDVKAILVMDGEEATKYNRLHLAVYDGSKDLNSAHSAVVLHLTRSAGAGAMTSRLAFSGIGGVTAGYVEPDAWYHLKVYLPGAGSGESSAVITGLGGAKVYDLSEQETPSIEVKQPQGNLVADYESLSVGSGNSGESFLNAQVSNINVAQGQ